MSGARQTGAQRPLTAGLGLLLLYAAAVFGSLFLGTDYPGMISDAFVYLLMAEQLAGGAPVGDHDFLASSVFPPLYPAILAAVGAGPGTEARAHLLDGVFYLVAIAAYLLWLRRQELSGPATLVLGLLVLGSPVLIAQAGNTMSESLYLAATMGTLLMLDREPGRRWLAVSLIPLIRAAGITVVAATVVDLWLRRRRVQALVLAAASVALVAGWTWWKQNQTDGGLAYEGHFALILSQGLGAYLELVRFNILNLFLVSGRSLVLPEVVPAVVPGLMLVALGLVGLVQRLQARRLDAFYVLFYLVAIVLWPYPQQFDRLLLVILPLLYFHAFLGLARIGQKMDRLPPQTAIVLGGILVLSPVVSIGHLHSRLSAEVPPLLKTYRSTPQWIQSNSEVGVRRIELYAAAVEISRALPQRIGPEDCVYSISPVLTHYYSRRRAVHYPPWNTGTAIDRQTLGECRYALALGFVSMQARTPALFPLEQTTDFARVAGAVHSTFDRDRVVAVLLDLGPL